MAISEVRVDSLDVGTRRYGPLTALSRSYNEEGEYLPDIGGILAFKLFADDLVTLDMCHRRLVIGKGALPSPDGRSVLAYEERDGVPFVSVSIGGVREMALLDTGTDRAFTVPLPMLRRLFLAEAPRPLGKTATVTGEISVGTALLADPLVIGGNRFERTEVTFSASWKFPILGAALFHRHAITFDQKNRRIRIVRPAGC